MKWVVKCSKNRNLTPPPFPLQLGARERLSGYAVHSYTSIDLKLKSKPDFFKNEQMYRTRFAGLVGWTGRHQAE